MTSGRSVKMIVFVPLALVLALAGCKVREPRAALPDAVAPSPERRAVFANEPITLDGRLDEALWHSAPAYALTLSRDKDGQSLAEPGEARFAWDGQHLYVAIHFTDSDIVAEGREDQLHHYLLGDVAELFLKPANQTWYWECYATPTGKKTTFFFPGRGRLGLPSCFADQGSALRVAAHIDGTLGDWRDKDNGWTAEMAIPVAELAAVGEPFDPDHLWMVLVARYNYSRYLNDAELSMSPTLLHTSFHLTDEYAPLRLDPLP